jgi:hypothetical protein
MAFFSQNVNGHVYGQRAVRQHHPQAYYAPYAPVYADYGYYGGIVPVQQEFPRDDLGKSKQPRPLYYDGHKTMQSNRYCYPNQPDYSYNQDHIGYEQLKYFYNNQPVSQNYIVQRPNEYIYGPNVPNPQHTQPSAKPQKPSKKHTKKDKKANNKLNTYSNPLSNGYGQYVVEQPNYAYNVNNIADQPVSYNYVPQPNEYVYGANVQPPNHVPYQMTDLMNLNKTGPYREQVHVYPEQYVYAEPLRTFAYREKSDVKFEKLVNPIASKSNKHQYYFNEPQIDPYVFQQYVDNVSIDVDSNGDLIHRTSDQYALPVKQLPVRNEKRHYQACHYAQPPQTYQPNIKPLFGDVVEYGDEEHVYINDDNQNELVYGDQRFEFPLQDAIDVYYNNTYGNLQHLQEPNGFLSRNQVPTLSQPQVSSTKQNLGYMDYNKAQRKSIHQASQKDKNTYLDNSKQKASEVHEKPVLYKNTTENTQK